MEYVKFESQRLSANMHTIRLQLQESIRIANGALQQLNELCGTAEIETRDQKNPDKKQKGG